MDNFMDRLVEKINAQGTMRNGSMQNSSDMGNMQRITPMQQMITEANLVNQTELITQIVQEGNEKQIALMAQILKQNEEKNKEVLEALVALETLTAQYKENIDKIEKLDKIDESFEKAEEHVHKESVKCYRNTQAVIVEQSEVYNTKMNGMTQQVSGIKSLLIALLILLVLNLGGVGVLIAHVFGLF